VLLASLLLLGCCTEHVTRPQVPAVRDLAPHLARPPYAQWKFDAAAAGDDCAVLFLRSRVLLDDSSVEAIHYGAGGYALPDGGLQQFARDRSFRAVVYRDASGVLWTHGATTRREAESLVECR
jgi:hypothetical protein